MDSRRLITPNSIEYSKLIKFDSRSRILIQYPWQVVLYQNKIIYIVPTNILSTSKDKRYRKNCQTYGWEDTKFCEIGVFEDCAVAHPAKYFSFICNETDKCLSRLHSYDVDKTFSKLELIEGESFIDFVHSFGYGDTDIEYLLENYIDKAVSNYNAYGDAAMEHYLNNQGQSEDKWITLPTNSHGNYIWSKNESNILTKRITLPANSYGDYNWLKKENNKLAPKAKKIRTVKFVRGKQYKLRFKGIEGCDSQTILYKCVQIIHTIKNEDVGIVVMKAMEEHPIQSHQVYCLNRFDCKKYHIKYEDGLEVFSQMMNWIPVDRN